MLAPVRAARGQRRDRLAVVEMALVADMVERIDMGVAVAVAGHREVAHAEGQSALADRQIVQQRHQVDGGIGIVRPGHLVDRDGHRHGPPAAHKPGRRRDLVRRQIVHRAAIVVRAPSAPILDGLEHRVECGEAGRRGRGQGCASSTNAPCRMDAAARPGGRGSGRVATWRLRSPSRMVSTFSLVTKIRPESPIAGSGFCSQWSMPRLRMMSLWKV